MSVEPTKGERTGTSRAWGFVLVVFAVSRLFYLLAGTLLVRAVPINQFQQQSLDVPFGTLSIWARMDSDHYLRIAEGGYEVGSSAFFPLYPLVVRSVDALFGGPVSRAGLSVYGVFISLAAFYFALYFAYRIAERGWGVRTAEGTVLTLAFFPTSFFFNAVFTESLFLALSAGAIWAATGRRNLLLACLLAGLATATRHVGLFLLVPLLYEWWRYRRGYGWRVAYLALVPAGLLAYMVYLWWRFSNPLLFYSSVASGWDREPLWSTAPLYNIFRLAHENIQALFDPANYEPLSFSRMIQVLSGQNYLYNLLFLLFALVMMTVGWRRLPFELRIYGLALIAIPILFTVPSNPLMSIPRYLLVVFPLFIVLGTLLKDRRLLAGYLLISVAASLVFTALFVGWYFVA
jgi:hypothetical protein